MLNANGEFAQGVRTAGCKKPGRGHRAQYNGFNKCNQDSKGSERMKDSKEYTYEVGPIRPPSEAASLLLRVTRNCPWNRCKFCGVYKKTKFSLRPKEHVIKDIDSVKMWTDLLKAAEGADAEERNGMISRFINELNEEQSRAYSTAVHWYRNGMKSIFLQDSDSLVIKPDDLVTSLSS